MAAQNNIETARIKIRELVCLLAEGNLPEWQFTIGGQEVEGVDADDLRRMAVEADQPAIGRSEQGDKIIIGGPEGTVLIEVRYSDEGSLHVQAYTWGELERIARTYY